MGSTLDLVAYADGDYASKASGRRSVSVGAVMCAGACVYCFLRAQKCGTLSTTEAKRVALADTTKVGYVYAMRVDFHFSGLWRDVHHVFRKQSIMREDGSWHKSQCTRRILITTTCDPTF